MYIYIYIYRERDKYISPQKRGRVATFPSARRQGRAAAAGVIRRWPMRP